jgi:hypothetical protein
MTAPKVATGTLVSDPVRRTSQKGAVFATGTVRAGSGDAVIFVGIVAFGAAADRLLEPTNGDAVSATGRGELRLCAGRDGAERHGPRIVANEVIAAKPRPRERKPGAAAAARQVFEPRPLPDDPVEPLRPEDRP